MKKLLFLILVLSVAASSIYAQTFTEAPELFSDSLKGISGSTFQWGDYDNDGDLDLFAGSWVYRNDSGTFSNDSSMSHPGSKFELGDFDNDGDLDFVTNAFESRPTGGVYHLIIYRNDGNVFTDIGAPDPVVEAATFDWGDFDNDGDLDLLISGYIPYTGNVTRIYENKNGDFNNYISLPGANGSATWGDFDNDGDLDILVTGQKKDTYTPRTSAVYRNDSGEFTDIGAGLEPNSGKSLWGDYDNDGDLDILTSGDEHNGAKTRVYKNDAGTFTDIQADFIAIKDGTIEWLDYDNDGDLDIFETGGKAIGYNSDTSITVMYKNVAGTFTVDNTLAFANVKYATTTWGDFDDDGDLDLVMYGLVTPTTNYARMHMLYRNDSTNPNTAPTVPTNLSANATGNSVVLSWNASTDTETTDGRGLTYNIYIGTTSGGVDAVSPMADVSTGFRKVVATGNVDHNLSWSFEGLKNGTHYWSVQAIDPGFKGSAFAAEGSFASVDDAPAVPLEFTAKSGNSSVLLSWKPNTETDLNFYQIFRNSEDNSGTAAIIDTAMATDSTYEDKGLVIGQTYYYWLNASDNNGNESGLTSTASAVPKDFEPPAKPIGLLAYPSGKGVGLIWNANDEDDLAHYAIYRSKTSFELDADSIGIATSDTTYQDDSAEVDSLYFYRVSAVDVNGNKSSLSDAAEAVPAVLGRSLSLDGDGDYVDFGTANSDIFYGTFTQEAWIKTSNSNSRCEIIGWSTPYDDFVVEFRMA
ncbi:MAG: VCBS repeat-containing protein, partial [Bacteroidetes bacterium]|nr:VCBS repeat-containing protein [Bacteroidota bacterium]